MRRLEIASLEEKSRRREPNLSQDTIRRLPQRSDFSRASLSLRFSAMVASKRFENSALRTVESDLTTGISTAMRRPEDTAGRNCQLRNFPVSKRSRDQEKSYADGSSGPEGVPGGRLIEGQVTSPGRPAAGRKPNEFPVTECRAGSPNSLDFIATADFRLQNEIRGSSRTAAKSRVSS